MYAEKLDDPARRSAQTVMYHILSSLVRMVAPVLSFTAEEVWRYIPKKEGTARSVLLSDWPQAEADHLDADLSETWKKRLAIRGELTKFLEMARRNKTIGHSLDAAITIYADGDTYAVLKDMDTYLSTFLIVSEAHVKEGVAQAPAEAVTGEELPLAAVVEASKLEKCERCWIHRPTVGDDKAHPTICDRCSSVLEG